MQNLFFLAILFRILYLFLCWLYQALVSARGSFGTGSPIVEPPLCISCPCAPDAWAWVCRGLPRPQALTALCSVHRLPERLGPHRRRPLPAQASCRYVRASMTPPQTPPQTPRGRWWAVDSPLQPLGGGREAHP